MSYISIHKRQLIDSLENQILYANIACVIIGESGLGKSYIIEQISNRVRSDVFVSEISAEPGMTQAQIEKTICLQLGLSWQQSNETLLEKIASQTERRTLLVIDDAETLDKDCLSFLLGMVATQLSIGRTNLFLLLAGKPKLAKKLGSTTEIKNNTNLCALFELEPIEQHEIKHFVAQFQAADIATIEAIYESQKLDYFWQLSKGVPGDLAHQVKRWLSQEKTNSNIDQKSAHSFSYFSALTYTFIAIVLITTLFYQDEINQYFEPKEKIVDVNTKSTTENTKAISSSKKKEKLVDSETATKQPAHKKSEEKVLAHEKPEDSLSQKSKTVSNSKSQNKQKVDPLAGLEKVTSDLDKKTKNFESGEKTISEERGKESVTKEYKKESNAEETFKNSITLTKDEVFLNSQSSDAFTLQWVGVSELKAAERYRISHPLKNTIRIFRRKAGSKTMYLVASGVYNSKADATNAKLIYKQRGYSGTPWIKSIAAVKQDIKSNFND